jgi:hypothetical protein
MFRFFRKIRLSLIHKNKISKYVLYALGEIILVVIGILLALFINQENEKNKLADQELDILINLKQEFDNNLIAAKRSQGFNKEKLEGQQAFLNFIDSDTLETASGETYFKLMVGTIGNSLDVRYENGKLKELLFSGRLQLISNDSIRGTLSGWEKTMKDLELQLEYLADSQIKVVDLITEKGNLRQIFKYLPNEEIVTFNRIPKNFERNSTLFRSDELQNKLFMYYAASLGLNKSITPTYIKNLEGVITLLDAEINRFKD